MLPNWLYYILFIILITAIVLRVIIQDWLWVLFLSILLLTNYGIYYRNNQIKKEDNSRE